METRNLYQKIQDVSNEIRNIEKNLQVGNEKYGYKAVSDKDVVLAVKDAETKHKIYSIPFKQELINSEVIKTTNAKGIETLKFVDNIKMTVRIIDLDNISNYIEVESLGKGIDTSDKGFGKASTYARKYALLNAYKIVTGEDPEAEKSQEIESSKTIDKKLVAITNFLNNNNDKLQNVYKHYNVGELSDLTEKQINEIYFTFKKRNLL